jgi:PEP-CTERM motif-containing protein
VQDSEFIEGNASFADGTIQGSFITTIPEPNTFVLLVLGLAGLLSYRCWISDEATGGASGRWHE